MRLIDVDALIDLANYAVMTVMEMDRQKSGAKMGMERNEEK